MERIEIYGVTYINKGTSQVCVAMNTSKLKTKLKGCGELRNTNNLDTFISRLKRLLLR